MTSNKIQSFNLTLSILMVGILILTSFFEREKAFASTSNPFPMASSEEFVRFFEVSAENGRFSGVAVFIDNTGNQQSLTRAFAGRVAPGGSRPGPKTIFRIASLSKLVAHVIALRAHASGVLDLDRPLASTVFIPSEASPSFKAFSARTTLRELLRHAPGWSLSGASKRRGFSRDGLGRDEFLRGLEAIDHRGPPNYCNVCFDLVGVALEDRLKMPFLSAAADFLTPSSSILRHNNSVPFSEARGMWRIGGLWRQGFFPSALAAASETFRASGNVSTTMEAMERFVGGLILGLREDPRDAVAQKLLYEASLSREQGVGLIDSTVEGVGRVLWHNGSHSEGFKSAVILDPKGRWGAFLLSNLMFEGGAEEVLLDALKFSSGALHSEFQATSIEDRFFRMANSSRFVEGILKCSRVPRFSPSRCGKPPRAGSNARLFSV